MMTTVLPTPRTTKSAHFTTLCERAYKVDDLDASLEDLGIWLLGQQVQEGDDESSDARLLRLGLSRPQYHR